ncbi:Tripartite motif-containing protein 2, partial [Geodia barretti]
NQWLTLHRCQPCSKSEFSLLLSSNDISVLSVVMAGKPQATTEKPGNPAQQVLEKLSNQLSCSVCLEEYRRPRVLPCLHVFCEACLEKLVGTQRDKLSALCPNCR